MMKIGSISTSAVSDAARLSLMKLQAQLVDAQKEVSTGRHVDVGLSLGDKTGQVVSLRQQHMRLEAIIESNSSVATRLDATQQALETIAKGAEAFSNQLVAGRNILVQQSLQGEGKAGLASLIGMLNMQVGGAFLFAGINADVKPVADYNESPPPASKQAVDAAFLARFGFSQSDPAVANISAVDMQDFLDNEFAALFDDAAWKADWSQASDQNVRSRISSSELLETSTNANEPAMRKLAAAYTMVGELGTANLSQAAYDKLIERATQLVMDASQDLTALRTDLGAVQQRVSDANDRMAIQRDVLSNHIGVLEGVDPYEASSRLSQLMTQVEASYAMTARISKLTILNYL